MSTLQQNCILTGISSCRWQFSRTRRKGRGFRREEEDEEEDEDEGEDEGEDEEGAGDGLVMDRDGAMGGVAGIVPGGATGEAREDEEGTAEGGVSVGDKDPRVRGGFK